MFRLLGPLPWTDETYRSALGCLAAPRGLSYESEAERLERKLVCAASASFQEPAYLRVPQSKTGVSVFVAPPGLSAPPTVDKDAFPVKKAVPQLQPHIQNRVATAPTPARATLCLQAALSKPAGLQQVPVAEKSALKDGEIENHLSYLERLRVRGIRALKQASLPVALQPAATP